MQRILPSVFVFAAAFLAGHFAAPSASAFEIPSESQQLIVGIAPDWGSSHVTLSFYQRQGRGAWVQDGPSWKGRLGRNGLSWGRGIHPMPEGARTKREGDGRAPAGVFHLGAAWGYAPDIRRSPNLLYTQVTSRDLWCEDPKSPYYNRYRRIDHEPRTAEERAAQMVQGDHAHSLKLFIAHNAYPDIVPGAGSSIFFHIWRRGGAAATAGCTTMSESDLQHLIARVEPQKLPVYVLLPAAEYERYRSAWKLP